MAKRVYLALLELESKAHGQAYVEAGYKLSDDPPTWIQPDVSFLRNERALTTEDGKYFSQAPDLAVEIVSPSETATALQRKVERLLGSGSQAVWVIYPETRSVQVHVPGGTSFARSVGDSLIAPYLLASWELPVAALFDGD